MAIRYVKDFEFPAAAGYTKSATPVTGQMYAKGGEAKAPKGKGMMLIIGMGDPKPPMKKAEGSYVDQDDYMKKLEARSPIQSGTYGKKKPEAKKKPPTKSSIPGTNVEASDIMDADDRARLERGYKKGGKIQYEDGGKDTSVSVKDVKSGKVKQSRDADYYREMEQMKKPAFKKGGAMKHEDEAMDRKLVKQMIKPAALKKMGGGMAQDVQMAKSNAISKSLKGQKQTPMAKGGMKRKFADGGMNDMDAMSGQNRGPITQPGPMTGGGMDSIGSGPKKLNLTADQYQMTKGFGGDPLAGPRQLNPRQQESAIAMARMKEARETREAARALEPPPKPRPANATRFDEQYRQQKAREAGASMRERVNQQMAAYQRPGLQTQPGPMAMKSGGKVKSPLQSMGISPRGMSLKQAKGVPATSRAPMIAPLAMGMGQGKPAVGSGGVGVNEARPGKPNVGAIRSAMAKAATAANPDASPAMMKRGGKASMSKC